MINLPDMGALSFELTLQGPGGAPLGNLGQPLGCYAAIFPNPERESQPSVYIHTIGFINIRIRHKLDSTFLNET